MDAPTIPNWLLEKFPPSRDPLLQVLVTSMPESLFREIALCDCGMDYDENLAALKLIGRTGNVPIPLEWNPREVCCLTRWGEVKHQKRSDKDSILGFHKKRAFACCVLTIAEADQPYDSEKDTLIQLVESIVAMEQSKFAEAAISMLNWHLTPEQQLETDRPFFIFAMILLALLNKPFQISSAQLSSIADWLSEEELYAYSLHEQEFGWVPNRSIWMTVLFASRGQRDEKWRTLAQRLSSSYPVFEPWVLRMTQW